MNRKYNLAILTNEQPDDHYLWVAACEERKKELNYTIVNLTSSDWLEKIKAEKFDYLLTKPSGLTSMFKQLYDERLSILVNELKILAFPTLGEVLIYENKRYFSFWLDAHDMPHPDTGVFYHRKEAVDFINRTNFPVVGKLNIGASGHGVEILKDIQAAREYIGEIFTKGKTSRTGPNISKGNLFKRVVNKLKNPSEIVNRLKVYNAIASDRQKGYVILQEFIPHNFEWRVVRIGDSFFAHKKLLKKDKASGSLLKGYINPPLKLLDFVKEITDRFEFYSQAVDIFETNEGHYLVNEMQCIFGQSDPYQMLVNGKPGRYVNIKGKWIFEEGIFNRKESYDLRLQYVLSQLNKRE